MSVSLRLSRGGSKKRPFFRIVAADVRAPRDGKYLERLGTYNPMRSKDDPERINLNLDRIKYWLSVGARPTERVNKFLATEGLTKNSEIPQQTKQDKPRKKTLEKLKAKEEKLKSKEELKNAGQAEASSSDKAETEQNKNVPQASETQSAEPEAKAEQSQDAPQTSTTPSVEPEAKAEQPQDAPQTSTTPPAEQPQDAPQTSTTPPAEPEAKAEQPQDAPQTPATPKAETEPKTESDKNPEIKEK